MTTSTSGSFHVLAKPTGAICNRDVGTVFVQMFDAALASWVGAPPALCIFSETCGDALALEHNGDVYSCDHFVEPKYLLGNIAGTSLAELVGSPQQRAFGAAKRDTLLRQGRYADGVMQLLATERKAG